MRERIVTELHCPCCGKRLRIYERNIIMPYKTKETAECPYCGTTVYEHNSRGDFEAEVTDGTER